MLNCILLLDLYLAEEKPAFDLKLLDLILKQQAGAALQLNFSGCSNSQCERFLCWRNPGHCLLFDALYSYSQNVFLKSDKCIFHQAEIYVWR